MAQFKRPKKLIVINIIITAISFISLVFSLVGVFIEEGKIPTSLSKLSPYIVILSVLTMALVWLFDRAIMLLKNEYDMNTKTTSSNYTADMNRLESSIKNISSEYNKNAKAFSEGIIATLIKQTESLYDIDPSFREFVLFRLNQYLTDKKTGRLDDRAYYDELENLAKLISDEKKRKGDEFKGEIWAQSSFLENEWESINKEVGKREKDWVKIMKGLDDDGIPTTRLYIFSKKHIALLKGEVSGNQLSPKIIQQLRSLKPQLQNGDLKKSVEFAIRTYEAHNGEICDEVKDLLFKLAPYLTKLREHLKEKAYVNTVSYAITEEEYKRVTGEDRKYLGVGYFAVTFKDNNRSIMIDDVDPSDDTLTKLQGSVIYCEVTLKKAIVTRATVIKSAIKMDDFLESICSDSVREYMNSEDFVTYIKNRY